METYEQKYKEALERARLLKLANPDDEAIQTFVEDSFPELRESEDERIRKNLMRMVQNVRNDSTEEGYYDIPFDKYISYLEKQKENPKSADSIQSDCVSDAKCKNRWHKVGDSLPDSAREVICKDAIGNFFIGRYYKGSGSWEVSMYDDVDKSNEDNPPVIMWCDIPSENQKKPDGTWTEEDDAKVKAMCKEGNLKPSEIAWLKELKNRIVKEQKSEEFNEYKIIKKHITEDSLSSEVNKRLTECGWYVTDEKLKEWSEEDKRKLNRIYEILGHAADDKGFLISKRIIGDNEAIELQDFLKSLKDRRNFPKSNTNSPSGWSDEDEEMFDEALTGVLLAKNRMNDTGCIGLAERFEKAYKWLESFRPRPHWKPSEEQMEELNKVRTLNPGLDALYQQLKNM